LPDEGVWIVDDREREQREQEVAAPERMGRGDFLKWAGLLGLTPAFVEALLQRPEMALAAGARGASAAGATASSTFTPVRPPATPLIVRGPYVSAWQFADNLAGTWPTFWNGSVKAIAGIVRVDGTPYVFMGNPTDSNGAPIAQPVTQTNLTVTATQSIYTLQAGPVTLLVTFLSPVEATDLRRLSMPLGYIHVQAQSADGSPHHVSVYVDISGEWAHAVSTTPITWARHAAPAASGGLTALTVEPATQATLTETSDYPNWGMTVLATRQAPRVTYQIAQATVARGLGATQGRLNNTVDQAMPQPIAPLYTVLAFNADLGTIRGRPSSPFTLVLGQLREPAIQYLTNSLPPLWKSYWRSWQGMFAFALDDARPALVRASALDAKVKADATTAAGGGTTGAQYAALCALALRQAFGGVELVRGPDGTPWFITKEISSSGNVSTVDVIYPGFPAYLYTNPSLMRLLLAPIIDISERPVELGGWFQPFAIHDIGTSYPIAAGHVNVAGHGSEEDMPVEETANMLIMATAYMQATSKAEATAYATAHYPLFKQWAEYLTADNGYGRSNALDPENQNQTDDFAGTIAHSTNLALKAIIGVAAMGTIATFAGQTADAVHYTGLAQTYIGPWAGPSANEGGQDPSGKHLMLQYTEPAHFTNPAVGLSPATDGTGTWSIKYNAYPDKLLGTNLVPAAILQEEANWYETQKEAYGIPLDSRHTAGSTAGVYTKADWELWTAAATNDAQLRQDVIGLLYKFVSETTTRVPFTDLYDTMAGTQYAVPNSPAGHFQARSVIGGLFALLTLQPPS